MNADSPWSGWSRVSKPIEGEAILPITAPSIDPVTGERFYLIKDGDNEDRRQVISQVVRGLYMGEFETSRVTDTSEKDSAVELIFRIATLDGLKITPDYCILFSPLNDDVKFVYDVVETATDPTNNVIVVTVMKRLS